MFFPNHKKQVKIDRESVCMADDCMAPNEKVFTVKEKEKLLDVFWRIAEYLPRMSNAVWAVDSGTNVLGYIIMDADIRFELCQENQIFSELGIEDAGKG